jgi:hypothetical protein
MWQATIGDSVVKVQNTIMSSLQMNSGVSDVLVVKQKF